MNAIGQTLHGKPNGKGGYDLCDCPVHGGHECLSVDLGNQPGTVTLYCHSCGPDGTPAIIESLKQMGLPWPDPAASPSFAPRKGKRRKQEGYHVETPEEVEADARQQEAARKHAAAAEEAVRLLKQASPDWREHPYAKKKDAVFGGLDQNPQETVFRNARRGAFPGIPDALLIPFRNFPLGEVRTVQAIAPNGEKRFLAGGEKKGNYYALGPLSQDTRRLYIAEGVATAGAVWKVTGEPCIAAADAGNLSAVAQKMRKLCKWAEIIILADEDPAGIDAAQKAARVCGGKVARPQAALNTDAPPHFDFWDLWHEYGETFVRRALDKALPPPPEGAKKKEASPLPASFAPTNDAPPGEIPTWVGAPPESADRPGEAPMASLPGKPSLYPPGFYQETEGASAGLWHVEHNKDGEPVKTRIGPCLHILGMTRDTDSKEWGLFLKWKDDDGTPHSWAMPKSMLEGDSAEYRKRLASEGWSCAPNQRARNKLAEFLATVRREKRILCVPRTGWHKGAYVFPDGTIRKESVGFCPPDEIVLQTDRPHNPFAQQGSLEAWQEGVGRLAQGNSRLVLALSAALAATLLEVCGLESGGFHFMGASSTGKTTALLAAASVWGKGSRENGYILSWRATDNGLEGEAALHSDALLCLDEIKQASARTVDEAAYMLANGTGKSRARKDGTARQAQNWRCLVLSTGEESLVDRIGEAGGSVKAGQQVRLLDIPADAGAGMGLFEDLHGYTEPSALADAVQRAAAANYGTAARAFIHKVQECSLNKVREDWQKFRDEALEKLVGKAADGQVKRAGERFLLCAFAGEAARAEKMGILPWEKGEAVKGIQTCFRAWIEQRGGKGAAEDLAIVRQVRLFLEQHGNSRFQDFDFPEEKCLNRAGFKKQHGDTLRFYVLSEVFKREVVSGYDPKRAGKVLYDAGMLEKPEDPQAQMQRMTLPGLGRQRCYVLSLPQADREKED